MTRNCGQWLLGRPGSTEKLCVGPIAAGQKVVAITTWPRAHAGNITHANQDTQLQAMAKGGPEAPEKYVFFPLPPVRRSAP